MYMYSETDNNFKFQISNCSDRTGEHRHNSAPRPNDDASWMPLSHKGKLVGVRVWAFHYTAVELVGVCHTWSIHFPFAAVLHFSTTL